MEFIQRFAQVAGAAMVVYGGLVFFQGATEIAKNRRQRGGATTSEEWWALVEGVIWIVFGAGGFLWTMLSSIQG
ncbi:MAG: hypothetical protein J6D54_12905 [Olsenella sp.]|nr:hypothetical protein [Olsenella sp.]